MSRVAWPLLALLVGSGLVWGFVACDDDERSAPHAEPAAGGVDERAPGLNARVAPESTGAPAPRPPEVTAEERARRREIRAATRLEVRKLREAEQAAQARANALVESTIARVVQVVDAGLREQGMAELLDYLRGDRYEAIAALRTFWKLEGLDVDHDTLREAALSYAKDTHFPLRAAALKALGMLGMRAGDEALVLPLVSGPTVDERRTAGLLLARFHGDLFNETVADAVLTLLDDHDPGVVWQLAWDMPTKDLPPEVVTRLVEIARSHPDATTRYRVLRGAVSDLDPKTKEVVDYLFENVAAEQRIREFALQGLTRHVPADLAPYVADRLVELIRTTDDARAQYELAEVLVRHGDVRHAPTLERMADNALAADPVRAQALRWAKLLRRRTR